MSRRNRKPDRPRRGVALIAVLWVVLIAGIILLGINKAARMNLRMAHNELQSVQARWLARAGIEQGLAVLEDDLLGGTDSMLDFWYEDPISFERIELGAGEFSVTAGHWPGGDPREPRFGLIDHNARINLNTADEKQLAALRMLTRSQVAAILDWRDKDNNASPGGAEQGFYQRLPFPYLMRNGPFGTFAEVRLVRDIDAAAFHGEDANLNGVLDDNEDDLDASRPEDNGDGLLEPGLAGLATVYSYEPNEDALGSPRLNVNTAGREDLKSKLDFTEALAQGVVEQRGRKKFGRLMDLLEVKAKKPKPGEEETDESKVKEITIQWLAKHIDELTVTDEERLPGRINVNTAPREVLLTLPEMTTQTADAIATRRVSAAGPLESVGELLGGRTVSEKQFKAFAELLTVRSSVFEIRSRAATAGGIRYRIVAVVDRGTEPMSILYWYEGE